MQKPSAKKVRRFSRIKIGSSFLKIGQAAQVLGVSIDTLRRWEQAGKISTVRTPGGTRLYHISALKEINPAIIHIEAVEPDQSGSLSTEELLERASESESHSESKYFDSSETVTLVPSITRDDDSLTPVKASQSRLLTKFLIGSAFLSAFTLLLTGSIVLAYFTQPKTTEQVFKNNIASGLLFPFHKLAEVTVAVVNPVKAKEWGFMASEKPPPVAYRLSPVSSSNVLAVTASSPYLEINGDTLINGSLSVRDAINNLTIEATPSANTLALTSGSTTLTVTKTAKLDQDVSTAAAPTFNTLNLSATSNQLVFQSGGPTGTLTWTPTAARIITLPDATTTLVGLDNTQTLTNKSISGSSNTLTNIPASALTDAKVTVTAGTNLTGGGEVKLGNSITIALKDSPAIAGVLSLADGTAAAPALTFTSDTDTGLYRIAANKIGLITGGSATSGITIDANGNVGIGTITPSYQLETTGNVGVGKSLTVTGLTFASGGLRVNGYSDLTGNVGIGGTATFNSLMQGLSGLTVSGSSNLQALSATNINATTLTTTGNVGIGATTSSNKLDVWGNSRITGTLTVDQTSTFGGNFTLSSGQFLAANGTSSLPSYSFTNSTSTGMYSPSSNALALNTSGAATPPLTITAGGNVGIGTTSPVASFHNSGGTLYGTLSVSDKPAGGNIGTAAATVDIYTSIALNQTTSSQTITLPNPTDATAGRIVYISNTGTASFTFLNSAVQANTTTAALWNGTQWTLAGGGGLTPGTTNNSTLRWNSATTQWVENGNVLSTSNGNFGINGNLGIGTTATPDYNLKVLGTGFFSGFVGIGSSLNVSGNVGIGQSLTVSSAAILDSLSVTKSISAATIGTSGNVGIGSSLTVGSGVNLSSSLNVVGNTQLSTLSVSGASTFTSTPTFSTMNSGSILFAGTNGLLSQNNANFYWDNTNNRLGIGTSAPDYTFRTQGTGFFSGFLGVGSSLNVSGNVGVGSSLTVTSAGVFSSGIKVSGAADLTTLSTSGNAGIGSSLTVASAAVLDSLSVTKSINAASLGVSGISNLAGNVGVGSSLTVTSAGVFNSSLAVSGHTSLNTLNVSGQTNINNMFTTGNVGIGATTSSNKLDVWGNARITGALTVDGNFTLGGSNTGAQFLANDGTSTAPGYSFTNETTVGLWRVSTGLLALTTGNSPATGNTIKGLSVNSNGNVGVGTTNSGYNLTVNGTSYFSGFVGIGSSLNVSGNVGIGQSLNVSSAAILDSLSVTKSISAATLGISGASSLTGNVGIGASLTTTGLGVFNGGLTASSIQNTGNETITGNLTVTGTSTFTGASTFSSTPTFSTMNSGSVLFAGANGLLSQNTANLYWNNSNTRLGIGTSAPSQAVQVNTSGTSAVVITSGGNIGIGTTSPSSPIQITPTLTSGTIFNMAYNPTTTLTGSLTGWSLDLNSGNVLPSNNSVTGAQVTLPTTTTTSGSSTLKGFVVNFGNGAGINNNSTGSLTYTAADLSMPALTQTQGTLTANGVLVTTPSSITTGGTANAINISATGVGAGSLNGVNIGAITGQAGTETAVNVGTGWDTVLKVGSTTVINGSGVTQVAGGGTGIASYNTGDLLYASGATTLTNLGIGTSGQVLTTTTGVPTWSTINGSSCVTCLINNPTSTSVNTISPTGAATTGLTVKQTSTASPTQDIFDVTDSTGNTKYFYVDKNGNASSGSVSSTTITLTPTSDTTALTLVGTNVLTSNLSYFNSHNTQGTIFNIAYGSNQTLTGTLTGQAVDFTNLGIGASNQSVTGQAITLPAVTNTNSSGTKTYSGLSVTTASGLNQNGAGATITNGVSVTIPPLTQTSGTITGNGLLVTTPSSITTGGAANGLNISASGIGAGTLTGINIGAISGGAGTETAITIGSGWDTLISNANFYVKGDGNLGIGTSNPTRALDVVGTGNISGNVGVGSSLTITGLTYSSGGLRVNGYSDLTGNVGVGSSLTVTSAAALNTLNVSGISNLAGNVGIGGTATFSSLVYSTGSFLAGSGSASAPSYSFTSSTSTGLWSPSTNALSLTTNGSGTSGLTITSAGLMGIGITSPSQTFQVNSGANSTVITSTGNLGIGTTTANSNLSVVGNTHIGGTYQGIAAPTNGLFVDGNVGIGATTSSNKLDVWGNARIAGNLTVDGTSTYGGNFTLSSGQFLAPNGSASLPSYSFTNLTNAGLWTNGNGLLLTTGGSNTNGITVTGAGNVGIGTTAPTQLLDVRGNIYTTGTIGSWTTTPGTGVAGALTVQAQSKYDGLRLFGVSSSAPGITMYGGSTSRGALGIAFSDNDWVTGSLATDTILRSDTSRLLLASNNTLRMIIDTNGNVGIGTTPPQAKLYVSGNAMIGYTSGAPASLANGLAVSGSVGIGTTTPNNALQVIGAGVFGADYGQYTAPTNGLFVEGNVGIGATTSNNKLDVWGNQRITGTLTVDGSLTTGGQTVNGNLLPGVDNIYSLGSTSLRWSSLHVGPGSVVVHNDATNTNWSKLDFAGSVAQLITDSATPLQLVTGINNLGLYINTSGNVGVGTTSPDYAFRTQGTGFFSGFVGIGSSMNVSGNVGIGTSLTVSSAAILDSLSVTKSINAATLGVSGVSNLAGNVGIGNSLTVTGLTYSSGGLRVNGFSDLTGNVGIGGTATFNSLMQGLSGLTVSGSSNLQALSATNINATTLTTTGNVGIGATTSSNKLDVWGNSRIAGTLTLDSNLTLSGGQFLANNGTASLPSYSFTNSTSTGIYSPSVNALALNTNGAATPPLTITAGGNVGIGVTNPVGALQVNGAGAIGYGSISTSALPSSGLAVSGNVGIGTTSPKSKLQVTGTAAAPADGNQILTIAESGGTSMRLGTNTTYSWIDTAKSGVSYYDLALAPSGGNVGIGTTTASYNLSVIGTANFTGNVGVGSSLTTTGLTFTQGGLRVNGYSSLTGNIGVGGTANFNSLVYSTGSFLGPNGSATTPAHSFTNLTNAGLWTNGDGLLLTTGGSNTSGLTVTGAGSVGIGVTSPSQLFQINPNASNPLVFTSTGNLGIGWTSPQQALHLIGTQEYQPSAGSSQKGCIQYNSTNGDLEYSNDCSTYQSFGATAGGWSDQGTYTRLTTTSANVGIGVSGPPDRKLQLANDIDLTSSIASLLGTNGTQFAITGSTGTGGTEKKLVLGIDTTDNYGVIQAGNTSGTAYNLALQPGGGNVGIGTISPLGQLQVGTSPTPGLIVLSGGNVGIGTTGPGAQLDVGVTIGWGGNSTGLVARFAGADSAINQGGNVRILGTSSAAINKGGTLTLGGMYTGTTSQIDFGEIAGRKENSTNTDAAGYLALSTRSNSLGEQQWMRITSAGNVGIGLTVNSPGLLLEVNGPSGLPATSGSTQTGVFRVSQTAGTAVMDFGSNGNGWIQTTISGNLAATSQHLLLNPRGGNVGVGLATDPANALDVSSGGIHITSGVPGATTYALYNNAGTLTFNGVALATGASLSGTTNYVAKFTGASTVGNSVMYDNGTNVGIGTATPGSLLEVLGTGVALNGTGYFNARFKQDNTNYRGVGLGYDTSGQIGLIFSNSASTASQLAFWRYTGSTWAESMRIDGSGNVGIGFTSPNEVLQVASAPSAATSLANILGANGSQLSLTGNAAGTTLTKLAIGMDTTNNFGYLQAGQNGTASNLILEPSGGNVGIGFTSPNEVLQVAAAPSAATSLANILGANGSQLSLTGSTATTLLTKLAIGMDTTNNFGYLQAGQNGTASNLILEPNGGNVGIGTSSPTDLSGNGARILEMQGGAAGSEIFLDTTSTSTGQAIGALAFTVSTTAGSEKRSALIRSSKTGSAATNITGDLEFFTTNANTISEKMRIDSAGNVGIGTAAPGSKLDIQTGNDAVQLGNFTGANSGIRFQSNASTIDLIAHNGTDTGTRNLLIRQYGASSGILLDTSGNVGIGTASPANLLDIGTKEGIHITSGVPTSTTYALYNNAGTLTFNGVALATGASLSGTTNYVAKFTGASTVGNSVMYDNGTNVGIGTASPTGLLHLKFGTDLNLRALQGSAFGGGYSGTGLHSLNDSSANIMFVLRADPIILDVGNVGIGFTAPNEALQVAAAPSAATSLANILGANGSQLSLTGNAAGTTLTKLAIGMDPTNNFGYLQAGKNGAASNLILEPSGGNVGIGFTSPTNQLQIYNASSHASMSLKTGSTSGSPYIDFIDPGRTWEIGGNYAGAGNFYMVSTGTNGIFMNPSGNVGIGTATPGYKLDVNGTLNVSGAVTCGSGCSAGPWTRATNPINIIIPATTGDALGLVSGNVGIGTTNPGYPLHVKGYTTQSYSLGGGFGTMRDFVYLQGPAGAGITIGNEATNGYPYIVPGSSGVPLIFATSPSSWAPAARMLIDQNGNVGIGFTSPNEVLQVASAPSAATSLANILGANGSQLSLTGSTATTLLTKLAIGMDTTNNFGYLQAGQNGAASNLILEPGGGNIGIGTTNPGQALHLVGQMELQQTAGAASQGCIKYNSSTLQLQWSNDCLAYQAFSAPAAGGWTYDSINNVARLTTNSTNVGIGFSSPDRKFQLSSDIDITSSLASLLGTNGAQFSITGSTAANLQKKLTLGLDTTDNYGVIQAGNTSSTAYNLALQPGGGNVGIGVTTPLDKMHIYGGNLRMNDGSGNVDWQLEPQAALNFTDRLNNVTKLTLNSGTTGNIAMNVSGGNVGIGTASPGYKLDVQSSGIPVINLESTTTTNGAYYYIQNNNQAGTSYFGQESSTGGTIFTGSLAYATVIESYSGTPGNNNIQFGTNAAIRMTIANGGNVGIGFTSPAATLDVIGTSLLRGTGGTYGLAVNSTGNALFGTTVAPSSTQMGVQIPGNLNNYAFIVSAGNTTSAFNMIVFDNGNNTVGTIQTSGSTTSYNTTSDRDLKQDLGIATSVDVLRNIKVHDFSWISGGRVDRGVFAQEAVNIKPTAIAVGDDRLDEYGHKLRPWQADYSKFVPDLIVGWQSHEGEIVNLQTNLATTSAALVPFQAKLANLSLDNNGALTQTGNFNVTGNLGIGTTAPQAKLQISGNSGNLLSINNSTSSILTITSGGNVGIGTTSPAGALHVVGQCVVGETKLKRRKRKKGKNGEWIDSWEDVEIKDIQEGDEILTLDENTGRFVVNKVKALKSMGIKEIFELTTSSGKTIRTTGNHPYLIAPKIKQERVAVFIDAANFEISAKQLQLKFDYRDILGTFFPDKKEVNFRYYTVDFGTKGQRRFLGYLDILGAEIITKTAKIIKKHGQDDEHKANFDVEISFDAALTKDNFDTLVLFSGDSDFTYMVEELQELGKKVVVVSPWRTTARELRKAADLYLNLEDMPFIRSSQKNRPRRASQNRFIDGKQILQQIMPFVKGGKWVKVKDLTAGQMIATLGVNGKPIFESIVSIKRQKSEQVFDIEVEGTHNFVGNDIVAHNTAIFEGGNVGIGTSNPQYTLEVNGTGKLNDAAWTYASDRRLKENIASVSAGLSVIEQLNPVTFDYKGSPSTGSGPRLNRSGFIAQEVQTVLPNLVTVGSDGMLGIRLEELMPYAVKAIQEQQNQINSLLAQQATSSALLSGLSVSSDGTLNTPKLNADHLTLSTDVNFTGSALASLLSRPGDDQPLAGTISSVDLLTALNSVSQAVLGIQSQEATTGARLAELEAKRAKVDDLATKVGSQETRLASLEEKLATLSAQIANQPTATSSSVIASTSASLSTAAISSQSSALADLQAKVASLSASLNPSTNAQDVASLHLTPPDILLATGSAQLANLKVTSDATVSGQLTAYNLNIQEGLKSLGKTTLADTLVAGNLTIDGTMSITQNSLNTLTTLYLQNSPLAESLDILNGAFTFSKDGTLAVSGTVLANQFAVKSGSSAGVGTIPAGQTDAIMENIYVDEKSIILITPHTPLSQTIGVIDRIKGGFRVALAHPETADLSFDYLIVGMRQ